MQGRIGFSYAAILPHSPSFIRAGVAPDLRTRCIKHAAEPFQS